MITTLAGPTVADTNQGAIAPLGHLGTLLVGDICAWTVPGATTNNS